MPEVTTHAPGTPSWVDLSAADLPGAKEFYAHVLGWTYDDQPMEGGTYSMAASRGRAAAGLTTQRPEQAAAGIPPAWNAYVTVADADASARTAREAGGTVLMEPFDVMDAGRMAVVQDPTGGVVCLWQGRGSGGAEVVNEPGAFTWCSLVTRDTAEAARFYGRLLGWEAVPRTLPDGRAALLLMLAGRPIALAQPPEREGVPTHWFVYFAVADADAAAAAVADAGGGVLMGPMDTPPGRMVVAADRDGASFGLISLDPDFDPFAE